MDLLGALEVDVKDADLHGRSEYLASLDDIPQLPLVCPVKVAVNLAVLSQHVLPDLLLELIDSHKVVVPSLHLSRAGGSCGVADAQLKDVGIAGDELCDDGALYEDSKIPFRLRNTH